MPFTRLHGKLLKQPGALLTLLEGTWAKPRLLLELNQRVQTITVPLRKLSEVGQTGQRQENYREILPMLLVL